MKEKLGLSFIIFCMLNETLELFLIKAEMKFYISSEVNI